MCKKYTKQEAQYIKKLQNSMFVNFYRNDLKLAFSALVFSKKKKKYLSQNLNFQHNSPSY